MSVKRGNMTMGTWVTEPQQINCLDQKDENQEIFQKYNIILGQERELVNHLSRTFHTSKGFSKEEVAE